MDRTCRRTSRLATGVAAWALPLVELQVAGHGRSGTAGKRHVDGAVSQRLRYLRHDDEGPQLRVHMA
jgi:alpha-galactosidase